MVVIEFFEEVFKPIVGYEGKYEISQYGTVKRLKHTVIGLTGQIYNLDECTLTHKFSGNKYRCITLSKNDKKKRFYIHLLVYTHFISDILLPGYQIDHDDNDKNNNYYLNLNQITIRKNSSKDRKPKSGYTGVTISPSGKFRATIKIDRKAKQIGVFNTAIEAAQAYQNALKSA